MAAAAYDPTDESGWYYLSFVDTDRPEGDRWLGGCFVEADHSMGAAAAAWQKRCNPGGEVQMWGPMQAPPEARLQNRLLNRDEVHSAEVKLRPIIHQHD
jgi:hypothetical protein